MEQEKPRKEAAEGHSDPEKTPKNAPVTEFNGFEAQGLLEPTRYGDWDVKGRCSDF